jgi:DNA-binding GntR family transcriptional regulator
MNKAGASSISSVETLSSPGLQAHPTRAGAESSAVDTVIDAVKKGIETGAMKPGQRITELMLTQSLGVSRGPVREALSRLELDGLLVYEKNRGVSVRKLSRDDIVNMLEVRESLEGLAARTTARLVRDEPGKEHLRQLIGTMGVAAAAGDIAGYNQHYAEFHQCLVSHSRNPLLEKMMSLLNIYLFRGQLNKLIDLQLVRDSHREHAALLDALLKNEPDKAERAVRKHIAHFTDHVRQLPGSVFD